MKWFGIVLLLFPLVVQAVGEMPIPDATGTEVETTVEHEAITGDDGEQYSVYRYNYTIHRPETDTGGVNGLMWDIMADPPFERGGLALPPGFELEFRVTPNTTMTFEESLKELQEYVDEETIFPRRHIPVGAKAPEGWGQSLAMGNVSTGLRSGYDRIKPGESLGGFLLYSPGPPTIREVEIYPAWMYIVEGREAWDPEDQIRAGEIQQEIIEHRRVIGPSLVEHGSNAHWRQVRSDLEEAIELGWVEASTAEALLEILEDAWEIARGEEPWLAGEVLEQLRQAVQQADGDGHLRQGMSQLLYHNARLLEAALEEEPPPPIEPAYEVEPLFQEHSIGGQARIEGRVINLADDDAPLVNRPVQMSIASGPHAGRSDFRMSDSEGRFEFGYQGTAEGLDRIYIHEAVVLSSLTAVLLRPIDEDGPIAWLEVEWRGGPDLVPEMFAPVYLRWDGEVEVFFEDVTANHGNLPAGESTTRFYISDTEEFVREDAYPVVERRVPPLEPGEYHRHEYGKHPLPGHLEAGEYWLTACVDADDEVVELDETNNCEGSQMMVMMAETSPDEAPVCEGVGVSPQYLWPPNHKMRQVELTEPDEDELELTVTEILQNEPLDDRGDGSTEPDASLGPASHEFALRAERSGRNTGRVYWVNFEGRDSAGAVCQGEIKVFVAHDRRQPSLEPDPSVRYDALTGDRVD